ncbi:MAG: flagellar hook-length control protein FliK, partial [Elusimicrobia bacterium]|nr:flagellar hook-length control protein FliK [Elusimicrobiota bacterium]
GLIVESPENSGVVEAVSRTGRELNSGIAAPVIENPKAKVGPTSLLESDQPAVPPAEVSTPDLSLPKAETDRPEGTPGTLDAARPPLPSNAPAKGSSDKGENPVVAKVERPIQQKSGPLPSVQSTMPALESKLPSSEQDATFREALKAVSEATVSLKGTGELVMSGDRPVSAPPIEKGGPVESVRPAVPVPELTPSPIELAKQIHVHLESGRSVVHVELHPDHLGEMNIALETKGKDVSMRFTVDNDTARHSVVAGLKELSGSLTTLGWTVNGLAVQVASGGVGNGRSDADGSRWAAFPVNANQVPVEQKTESRFAPSGAWRVDLVA